MLLTPGHALEYGEATALIEVFTFDAVLADKGLWLKRFRLAHPVMS
jgi:hypothetical protein